eukprot:7944794-Pyramimonas_sp.AAC.1
MTCRQPPGLGRQREAASRAASTGESPARSCTPVAMRPCRRSWSGGRRTRRPRSWSPERGVDEG